MHAHVRVYIYVHVGVCLSQVVTNTSYKLCLSQVDCVG